MISQNLRLFIVLLSAFIFLIIIFSIPFRTKYIIKCAGKLILPVYNNHPIIPVFIIILSALLITIIGFKELGFISDTIICLVSILGVAMGSEEVALYNKWGVYTNGLIGNGHFLALKEIYALPYLSYTKEEQEQYNNKVLPITTDKRGTINFIYKTEKECEDVKNALLKLAPDLRR